MDLSALVDKFLDLVAFLLHILQAYLEAFYKVFVPPPMRSLTGEIVLVTGSARGLGKEMCRILTQSKVTLIMWDCDKSENEKAARELQSMSCPGARIFTYHIDIANRDEVESVAAKMREEIGDVTILINNAGIAPIQPFLQTEPSLLEKTFSVNVLAQFWILREFLPRMIENHHGHIGTVCSIGAFAQSGGSVPYFGTKGAVHCYIESLKLQLVNLNAHGIRFTTIYPYYTDTNMMREVTVTKSVNRFQKILPFLKPEDVSQKLIEGICRHYEHVYCPRYLPYLLRLELLLPTKLKRELAVYFDSQLEHPNFPKPQKFKRIIN